MEDEFALPYHLETGNTYPSFAKGLRKRMDNMKQTDKVSLLSSAAATCQQTTPTFCTGLPCSAPTQNRNLSLTDCTRCFSVSAGPPEV